MTAETNNAPHDTGGKPSAEDALRPYRAAVIDCGTSAVRATIVQLTGTRRRVLEELEFPVDLTSGVLEGQLSRPAVQGILRGLRAISEAAKANGVSKIRAVGTSGLREAANSDFLLETVLRDFGIEIEVLDGGEEARIYCSALRELVQQEHRSLRGAMLFMDVGAGSTTTSLIRRGKLVHSVNEHFGTARVYELFKRIRDNVDFSDTVDRYMYGAVDMTLKQLPSGAPKCLVIAGADVRNLLRVLRPDASAQLERLPLKDLAQWYEKVRTLTPAERAEFCRMPVVQSALMLPVACLIRHLCRRTGHDEVLVTMATLRDGLIADLMPGARGPHFLDRNELLAAATQIAVKYHMDLPYAENTASVAAQIFDQTKTLHGLGEREKTLLEFAALVHDVGAFINVRNRHKHTLYIIESSEISGLSSLEKSIIAHVARYHRRSEPKKSHVEFQGMPRHARVVVSYLASILRIAYALDVERTRRIRQVRCEITGDRLLLHVDRRQVELERWSLSKKSKMFQALFGLRVEIVAKEQ